MPRVFSPLRARILYNLRAECAMALQCALKSLTFLTAMMTLRFAPPPLSTWTLRTPLTLRIEQELLIRRQGGPLANTIQGRSRWVTLYLSSLKFEISFPIFGQFMSMQATCGIPTTKATSITLKAPRVVNKGIPSKCSASALRRILFGLELWRVMPKLGLSHLLMMATSTTTCSMH